MRILMLLAGLVLLAPVSAQQPSAITLSCNGTSRYMTAADDVKPEAVTGIGMIVDFTKRTVTFNSYTVPIEQADSTTVQFNGQQTMTLSGRKVGTVSIMGSVDRVTGAADAMFMYEHVSMNTSWDLVCKPATRLF